MEMIFLAFLANFFRYFLTSLSDGADERNKELLNVTHFFRPRHALVSSFETATPLSFSATPPRQHVPAGLAPPPGSRGHALDPQTWSKVIAKVIMSHDCMAWLHTHFTTVVSRLTRECRKFCSGNAGETALWMRVIYFITLFQ